LRVASSAAGVSYGVGEEGEVEQVDWQAGAFAVASYLLLDVTQTSVAFIVSDAINAFSAASAVTAVIDIEGWFQ